MGAKNSTITRVDPLMSRILNDNKLGDFISEFFGYYDQTIIEVKYKCAHPDVKEKTLSPSQERLLYLLHNQIGKPILKMDINSLRLKISNNDLTTIQEAERIITTNNKQTDKKWAFFEGNTSIDIYIETNEYIFIGEAKRTEDKLTEHTTHDQHRSQMVRHIEAALNYKCDKKVVPFFIFDRYDTNFNVIEQAKTYNPTTIKNSLFYYNESTKEKLIDRIEFYQQNQLHILTFQDVAEKLNLNLVFD